MEGKFIVFEGPDGSGKSVQAVLAEQWITEWKNDDHDPVYLVKEPGNPTDQFNVDIREMLFNKDYSDVLDSVEQGLLFFIDHYHLANWVYELVEDGRTVISDRWLYSQFAYDPVKKNPQVLSGRLYREYEVKQVQPDLVIQLDADLEMIMARLAARKGKDVSQEQKRALWGDKPEIEVHTELRQSYRKLSKRYQHAHELGHPMKWVTITQRPDQSPEDVFETAVRPLLLDLME